MIWLPESIKQVINPRIGMKYNKGPKLPTPPEKCFGMYWNEYKKNVWDYTELIAPFIKGIETRGFKNNHIDHIVSIHYGFKNKIPPSFIASIDNLEMVYYKTNMLKGTKLSDKSIKLLKKWGYEIPKYQKAKTNS